MPDGLGVGLNPVEMHDELLATMVDGARHDSSVCPFCIEKASSDASVPSGNQPSGAPVNHPQTPTEEGGTPQMSAPTAETMAKETHDALLAKAVNDAIKATDAALETKTKEAADAAKKVEDLETELATAKEDNTRLNGELDKAQVSLKAATDEVASLKTSITEKDETARLAKLEVERTEQAKGLKIFTDEYVTEKAADWAKQSDEDWAARVDEWTKAKPASAEGGAPPQDTAMSGTGGDLTREQDDSKKKLPARRAVLGLS